ncbi:MAG: Maf family protein [Candidatus Hadarchaeales archaeon]
MILLASRSPRRISLLRSLGLEFEVWEPPELEPPPFSSSPAQLAERMAVSKVLHFRGRGIVVSADTLVVREGRIYPKPRDEEEAVSILRELRGGTHVVVTGVAVLGPDRLLVSSDQTVVVMRDYSEEEICSYVRSGKPMDKAGAYGIQDAFSPVGTFEGCYQNVVGLPLCTLLGLLREVGLHPTPSILLECSTCPKVRELKLESSLNSSARQRK